MLIVVETGLQKALQSISMTDEEVIVHDWDVMKKYRHSPEIEIENHVREADNGDVTTFVINSLHEMAKRYIQMNDVKFTSDRKTENFKEVIDILIDKLVSLERLYNTRIVIVDRIIERTTHKINRRNLSDGYSSSYMENVDSRKLHGVRILPYK